MIIAASHAQQQNDTEIENKGMKKKFWMGLTKEKAGEAASVSHRMDFKVKSTS